jgi:hypothetical protein
MNEVADIPQFRNGKRADKCARCDHFHIYMKLREDDQGVPLYGHDKCSYCECEDFLSESVQAVANMQPADVKELWEKTGFLSAATPLETRLAVSRIAALPTFAQQWPEFMGLIISHTTDTRAALASSDNKFAHLVSHTEDFLQMAEDSAQLKEAVRTFAATAEHLREDLETSVVEPITEMLSRIDQSLSAVTARVITLENKKSWWRIWKNRS